MSGFSRTHTGLPPIQRMHTPITKIHARVNCDHGTVSLYISLLLSLLHFDPCNHAARYIRYLPALDFALTRRVVHQASVGPLQKSVLCINYFQVASREWLRLLARDESTETALSCMKAYIYTYGDMQYVYRQKCVYNSCPIIRLLPHCRFF